MNNKKIMWILGGLLALSAQSAFAAPTTIVDMFANGQASFDALIKLVKYAAIVIGVFLVVNSVYKFSQMGSDPKMTAKIPLTMFFCGIGIFAMVATSGVLTNTLAIGTNGPGKLFINGGNINGGQVTEAGLMAILTFIRLLGYIAFIRGWIIINDYAQGKQQASLAKGLTHLIGGVFAINISATAAILANTFAPGVPTPFN